MPNRRIDVNAVIDRFRAREQAGDPANPTAGFWWIYAKADGLYYMEDDGTITGPLAVAAGAQDKFYTFTVTGALTVDPGVFRLYNLTGANLTISEVHIAVNTAPTGAILIVDVHENGVTIFGNQANRPFIAIAAFTGNSVAVDSPTWENDNYLQVDVDQIGSTLPGEDLTITIVAS